MEGRWIKKNLTGGTGAAGGGPTEADPRLFKLAALLKV
jgi:hypothetical protein